MNVLAIGGHYDDVEIGCGGALAKHIADGDRVIVHVVTHSDYTDYEGNVVRDRATALREGEAAAKVIGYELIPGVFETKKVQFDHGLVEHINIIIDRYDVDLIYTHWDPDVHQDHQAIGRATLAAGRRVNRLLMYRSNMYMNTTHFCGNFFVDITDYMDVKIRSILAHENEVKKFGSGWLDFWKHEARNNGQRIGVPYAECFQLASVDGCSKLCKRAIRIAAEPLAKVIFAARVKTQLLAHAWPVRLKKPDQATDMIVVTVANYQRVDLANIDLQ